MMPGMHMRPTCLLVAALAMVACSDAATPTTKATTPDANPATTQPVLDDVTDDTADPAKVAKPLPVPTPVSADPAAPVTQRIGELGRLLGTINDRKTATAAKPGIDELIAEFGNLKVGHPDLGIPPNVTKRIEQLLNNREVEPALGESLRQLQDVLR